MSISDDSSSTPDVRLNSCSPSEQDSDAPCSNRALLASAAAAAIALMCRPAASGPSPSLLHDEEPSLLDTDTGCCRLPAACARGVSIRPPGNAPVRLAVAKNGTSLQPFGACDQVSHLCTNPSVKPFGISGPLRNPSVKTLR